MSKSLAATRAVEAYRDALARQNALHETRRGMMGQEIKELKAQALAELEYEKLNLR